MLIYSVLPSIESLVRNMTATWRPPLAVTGPSCSCVIPPPTRPDGPGISKINAPVMGLAFGRPIRQGGGGGPAERHGFGCGPPRGAVLCGMGPPAAARCRAGAAPVVIRLRLLVLVLVLAEVVQTVVEEDRCRAGESLVHGDVVIHGEYKTYSEEQSN